MKYARLFLKWMLPIVGILVLLNGAYIGLQGLQDKELDFVVTDKTWSTAKYGKISYYLYLCPIDKQYTCTSTTEHESVWNQYSVGDPVTATVSGISVQPGLTGFYGFICFAVVVSFLFMVCCMYIWELLVLLYKE